jgi:hypothetical protein
MMNSRRFEALLAVCALSYFPLSTKGAEAFSAYHKKFREQQFAEQGGYGGPLTVDYKSAIAQYFEGTLKDPDSAHVKFSSPRQGWFREAWVFHGDGFRYVFGWEVAVKANGKNGFGAYMGYKDYRFFFHDNRLIKVIDPNELSTAQADDQL